MSNQTNSTVQDEQAQRLERMAREAERMSEHARIAAVVGHMGPIRQLLDEIASAHAAKAQTIV